MRMIPTKVHGILDYLVGALLIAVPWLFDCADNRPATSIAVVMGITAFVYSLITRYELGALRLIPMKVHLGLDFMSGLLLFASPWLFGFSDRIVWPHVVVGLFEMAAALMTSTQPGFRYEEGHRLAPHA